MIYLYIMLWKQKQNNSLKKKELAYRNQLHKCQFLCSYGRNVLHLQIISIQ